MGLDKVRTWLNSQDAWMLGQLHDSMTSAEQFKLKPQTDRPDNVIVIDMMLLFKSFCNASNKENVGLRSLYDKIVTYSLAHVAKLAPGSGRVHTVVFVADIQSAVTPLKEHTQQSREAQQSKQHQESVAPYPNTHKITRLSSGAQHGDVVVYQNGTMLPLDVSRLLKTRALYAHVFDFCRRQLAAHGFWCPSDQCQVLRDLAVVFEYKPSVSYELRNVVKVGASRDQRPCAPTTAVTRTLQNTTQPSDCFNLAEGEMLCATWAQAAARAGFRACVWTSDSDILPILSHLCRSEPDLDVVWRRWPHFKPKKCKAQCVHVPRFVRNAERYWGLDSFLLLCVLGGNDFLKPTAFTNRLNPLRMMTSANKAKRLQQPRAHKLMSQQDREPDDVRTALQDYVHTLHRTAKKPTIRASKTHAPEFTHEATRRHAEAAMAVCRYWYIDWSLLARKAA